MELNEQNYYSVEANMEYLSSSQFKDFMDCEVKALARLKGEYVEPKTDGLLIGSYVDAYFSNELDVFIKNTPELLDKRKKEPCVRQALVDEANEIIKAIESDEMLMNYLNGKKQVVMTGRIANVKFKIKVDALHEDKIVDQKIMASINEKYWKEINGRNVRLNFVEAFGYDIQGAIYQKVVEQNTDKKMPFILAVATKEENPDKALINIDDDILAEKLELVKELAPRYDLIKKGIIEPQGCGNCPVCRKYKRLKGVVSYKEMYGIGDNDEQER